MNVANGILELIGNTPLVQIKNLRPEGGADIYAKIEGNNPGGSVKDRIALSMIQSAEASGELQPGGVILEPTSGNTGIGLALVSSIKGYKLLLTMPETMSIERRQLFAAFGAEVVLTEGAKGMKGAIAKADELKAANAEYFMPQQFKNPANPDVHIRTTAPEIINALGNVPDAFVAGVGTGGTITGVGSVFKGSNPDVVLAAIEPADSPVLSGGQPGPHKLAGLGAGFVPDVLDKSLLDKIYTVTNEDAADMARKMVRQEGIFAGISSGAAMSAAIKLSAELGQGKKLVVVLPDKGDKYLSTGLFS